MKGIFAVYKPRGITSHDVVNKVRKITGVKRVGHGGTLDPLASGVLVIGVGREATKQLDKYVKGEKEYVATIKLGFESTTDDEEGEKKAVNLELKPTKELIQNVLVTFAGKIEQTPPIYSAVKIKGTPAYKLARRGKIPGIKPRTVEIMQIEMLDYSYPFLSIRVKTGGGVYIRSLARDIGVKLETGAYLYALERTRVANFTIDQSVTLEKFRNHYKEFSL